MNTRNAILFAAVVLASLLHGKPLLAETPPNIIMIFTDDQGVNDVSCYGSEIPTPNIDHLASEGMKFDQFYAASSICTPSRFGLFTGRFAHRSKDQLVGALMFLEDVDLHRGIRPGEETYATKLKSVGYHTALVGKWHLGHGEKTFWPTEHGFDTFYGHTGGCVDYFTLHYANKPDWYRGISLVETDGYATDVITDEAIRVLKERKKDAPPIYLHISYNAPHFGKGWDEEAKSPVNIMQPKPDDLAKVTSIKDPLRRAFAAKVVGLDESIGKLLKAVDDLGMRENTLVIFMTDHGGDPAYGGSNKPLRGKKATLFEGGIRVPCIVRWPGRVKPGSETNAVTCAVDWFATFGDITGYQVGKTDGMSILPVLEGKPFDVSRHLEWKTGAHQSLQRSSWFAVRDGDWKLVDAPDHDPMLFDLSNDQHETTDLAAKHPEIVKRLLGSQ